MGTTTTPLVHQQWHMLKNTTFFIIIYIMLILAHEYATSWYQLDQWDERGGKKNSNNKKKDKKERGDKGKREIDTFHRSIQSKK